MYHVSDVGHDIVAVDLVPLFVFADDLDGPLASGAVAFSLLHLNTHGCHWKPLCMAGFPRPDILALDTVLLHSEE